MKPRDSASKRPAVLALFPPLDAVGGIQASGRAALESLECLAASGQVDLYSQCLPPIKDGSQEDYWSKMSQWGLAALQSLRFRAKVDVVLVWHLSLLRLLPLFRTRDSLVAVALFGIEAWQQHSGMMKALLRRTKVFLPISDFTWNQFARFNSDFSSFPHRVLPLGLGTVRHEARPPDETPAVLMISRLERGVEKGHREMIGAWRKVLELCPSAELWIAGDGEFRRELEHAAATLGISSRVHFWGQVTEAEKESLLVRCRALAMPSYQEGFGIAYLEAMRVGRPCLVSMFDAGREVVNPPEAGLAVDTLDAAQLASAVLALISPGPQWERWSINARHRYETCFTLDHFAQRLSAALFGTGQERGYDPPCGFGS